MKLFWFFYLLIFVLGSVKAGSFLYVHHFVLFMLFFWAILRQLLKGTFTFPRSILFCFLILLTCVVISFLKNADVSAIRSSSQLFIYFLSIFLTCFAIAKRKDLDQWVQTIIIGAGLNAAAGIYQSWKWIVENGFVYIGKGAFFRVTGLCVTPTDYVFQLTVGLLFSSTIQKRALRRGAQILYVSLLLLSMSRSAIVTLVILGAISLVSMQGKKRVTQFALVAMVTVLIILSVPSFAPIAQRIRDIASMEYNIRRLLVYQDILGKIFASWDVFLIGNGFGTYSFFHPIDLEYYDNPHNIFLHMLYSAGLLGLGAFLVSTAVLVATCYHSWRRYRQNQDLRVLLGTILCVQVCVWIVGLVEQNVSGVGYGWLAGAIFGAPLAIRKVMRAELI